MPAIFKNRKYWIAAGCVWGPWLMLVLGFYWLVLVPQEQRYKAVHQELAASSDQVSMARMASQPESRQRQEELLANLRERIEEFLVPAGQQDKILFEISRLANTYGLSEYAGKIRENDWSDESSQQPKIKRICMNISFRGSFQQFASFINALERSRPAVFVESAAIQQARQQSKQHSANLLVTFFIQPDSSAKTVSLGPKEDFSL